MKRLKQVLTATCVTLALLCTGAATAQQIQTPDTFSDNFEALNLGPLEGQPGEGFPGDWHAQVNPIMVTDAQARGGTQSIAFSEGFAIGIHVGFTDNNPNDGPVTWGENFSVYMPSTANGAFLRSEPFSNFPGDQGGGFGPQVAVFQNDANSFRVTVGGQDIGAGNFATDQWWDVSFTADGAAQIITDFSIQGAGGFDASDLSIPWNVGDLTLVRPERFDLLGQDVFVDNVGSRIVPEPATIWLLLLGGLGVLRSRQR